MAVKKRGYKTKLDSKQVLKVLTELKPEIKKFGVQRVGLFGSFAKNEQNYHSDVDVLAKFKESDFDNYMNLKFLLERKFKRKVDLVMESALRQGFEYVKKEAIYA